MAEEDAKKEEGEDEKGKKEEEKSSKKSSWKTALALVPPDQFFTPKGVIALAFIVGFEITQAILFPSGLDLIAETLLHVLLVTVIAWLFGKSISKAIKGQLAPLLISLIPILSDYLPEVIIINVILPLFL